MFGGMLRQKIWSRTLAAALAFTLLLGLAVPGAAALGLDEPHKPAADELPKIRIASNAVIDEVGTATGYLEVSVNVTTPAGKAFTYVGAALQYNSAILTPVSWTVDAKGDGIPVDLTGTTADS